METTVMTNDESKFGSLEALYGDIIIDHQRDPRNFGKIVHCHQCEEGFNPLCGDKVILSVVFDEADTKIKKIAFEGQGCSISMASSSIMMEEVEGQSFTAISAQIAHFRKLMQGEADPLEFDGDIRALSGVRKFPVRIKCALLPWMTLKKIVDAKSGVKNEPE